MWKETFLRIPVGTEVVRENDVHTRSGQHNALRFRVVHLPQSVGKGTRAVDDGLCLDRPRLSCAQVGDDGAVQLAVTALG